MEPALVVQVYWNVGPLDDAEASIMTDWTLHVKILGWMALTSGMLTSAETVTAAVEVQPLMLLVTVNI
jgi:hypothetical protein